MGGDSSPCGIRAETRFSSVHEAEENDLLAELWRCLQPDGLRALLGVSDFQRQDLAFVDGDT